jgi:hypothetical protein
VNFSDHAFFTVKKDLFEHDKIAVLLLWQITILLPLEWAVIRCVKVWQFCRINLRLFCRIKRTKILFLHASYRIWESYCFLSRKMKKFLIFQSFLWINNMIWTIHTENLYHSKSYHICSIEQIWRDFWSEFWGLGTKLHSQKCGNGSGS